MEHVEQSRPGYRAPSVLLQAYPADLSLCVSTCLAEYLKRTQPLRGAESKLFHTVTAAVSLLNDPNSVTGKQEKTYKFYLQANILFNWHDDNVLNSECLSSDFSSQKRISEEDSVSHLCYLQLWLRCFLQQWFPDNDHEEIMHCRIVAGDSQVPVPCQAGVFIILFGYCKRESSSLFFVGFIIVVDKIDTSVASDIGDIFSSYNLCFLQLAEPVPATDNFIML
ncbi:unnamed protein product [Porites lobata]|uniref:Aminotransferase-like plant mobile domain-containing protein n=1 Tax=Porites lobata TaxID=104759 RepID=A0ABN8Q873_9CNID|nr:unnamed protein product [Porites lobata]